MHSLTKLACTACAAAVLAGCGDDGKPKQAAAACAGTRTITAESLRADVYESEPRSPLSLDGIRDTIPHVPLALDAVNLTVEGNKLVSIVSVTSKRDKLDADAFYRSYIQKDGVDDRVPVGSVTGRADARRGAGFVLAPNGDCGFVIVLSEDVRKARSIAEDLKV